MVAADAEADARLGPDQRAARAQRRDRRRRREWPAIISPAQTARRSAPAGRAGPAHEQAARRYLLGGLLVCSHCGEQLVARPRAGGQRRYACAKGPGFAGCGKTYINADQVEQFVAEAVLTASTRPRSRRAVDGPQRDPDAQRWLRPARRRPGAARGARRRCTGNSEITMAEWRAAREPIEQRITPARKQLAQGRPLERCSTPTSARASSCVPTGTCSTSPSSTRSSPPSSITSPSARPPGYNRFDESRLTPFWRP